MVAISHRGRAFHGAKFRNANAPLGATYNPKKHSKVAERDASASASPTRSKDYGHRASAEAATEIKNSFVAETAGVAPTQTYINGHLSIRQKGCPTRHRRTQTQETSAEARAGDWWNHDSQASHPCAPGRGKRCRLLRQTCPTGSGRHKQIRTDS